jgi:hypothetical protein
VYLFRSRRECTYFTRTCAAFNSEPWVAVYFEREGDAELYLTSLENYERKYWARGVPIGSWKMTPNARAAYAGDAAVRHIALDFKTEHWNFDGNGVLVDGKVANARWEKT